MERCSTIALQKYNNYIHTPSLHTYRSLTSIFQDGEFMTQHFVWFNSNGPSPLHGQIQMSAAWGEI